MERDFLGLKWEDSCETVKEMNKDMCTDSDNGACHIYQGFEFKAFLADNELQWPFSNKVSSQPLKSRHSWQLMSCNAGPEDIGRKNVHDSITSPVFLPISSGYAFDCNSKPPRNKRNFNRKWMLPFNETVSVGSSNPLYNTYMTNAGGHVFAAPMKNHTYGGVSDMEQSSISSTFNIMNGTTHIRNQTNYPSRASAQLTIFYDNAVYVYDDVTPEKAKVIIGLAGNETSTICKTKEVLNPVAEDIPSNQAQPHVIVNSPHFSTATYREGTVPQARKASLDRFLERRKDRLKIWMP